LNKGLNSINICVSIYISIWWVEKWGGGYILMIIKNARYNILCIRIKRLDLGKINSLSLEIFKKF
ncbi:hypothetical protein, partial [Campylobacter jejuni]|uniref:hypothetical protein n=1 Tax=Campylobacter jejuni TaxID=197 RepID=UPI002740B89D